METSRYFFFLNSRTMTYTAEFPDGNPGNAWFVTFDPSQTIQTAVSGATISNATIALHPSQILTEPIQSTRIRFKIDDTWAFGNARWPFTYILRSDHNFSFPGKVGWLLASVVGRWGKYSGQVLPETYYIDVVVRVLPYHKVLFNAPLLQNLRPNEVTTIPISVINQGNYNDTIGFRIVTEGGYNLTTTEDNYLTLRPGERGNALVGIAVPPNFLDTGTLHSIRIQAFSTDQPNVTIGEQILPLQTEGIFVSEIAGAGAIGLLFIILLFILFLFFLRKRLSARYYQAPQKPWTIPEEQEHLADLKRNNPETYDKERMMMAEEYDSAMLWFDDYKKTSRAQRKIEKKAKKTILNRGTNVYKNLRARISKLTIKRPKKNKKIKPKKVKTVKEPRPQPTQTESERDKVMRRILKEQKRQARSSK